MSGSTDLGTIVFLILAVVILFRLFSVLGRRTGHERPPSDAMTGQAQNRTGRPDGDNVVAMPSRDNRPEPTLEERVAEARERVDDFMRDDNEIKDGLLAIASSDPDFDPKGFLEGAKTAYEMIVNAFAEGNKKTLQSLLNEEVYEGFEAEIDGRKERNEIVDTNFIGINRADIIGAAAKSDEAHVTVKFRSQLNKQLESRGVKLSVNDFIIKACANALQ
ncbi:MAG: Tim44/TimA family putative adaptor protein, partial [Pseudomonadota bacterium]